MAHKHILVIEADEILRDYVQGMLCRRGFCCDAVADARQTRLAEANYDLILSDLPKPFSVQRLDGRLERIMPGISTMRRRMKTGKEAGMAVRKGCGMCR